MGVIVRARRGWQVAVPWPAWSRRHVDLCRTPAALCRCPRRPASG
ncbi:putative leader peptide [Pseudonocardia sp. CA-142604]